MSILAVLQLEGSGASNCKGAEKGPGKVGVLDVSRPRVGVMDVSRPRAAVRDASASVFIGDDGLPCTQVKAMMQNFFCSTDESYL